jgi:hypothetical protein
MQLLIFLKLYIELLMTSANMSMTIALDKGSSSEPPRQSLCQVSQAHTRQKVL